MRFTKPKEKKKKKKKGTSDEYDDYDINDLEEDEWEYDSRPRDKKEHPDDNWDGMELR